MGNRQKELDLTHDAAAADVNPVTCWTVRIAASAIWAAALAEAWDGAVPPSLIRLTIAAVLVAWGIALWLKRPRAVGALAITLVAAGLFIPVALVSPFRAMDAPGAVVAEPGFVAYTICGAFTVSAMALAGAYPVSRAWRDISGRTAQRRRAARLRLAMIIGVIWATMVWSSTAGFLRVVRAIKQVQAPSQPHHAAPMSVQK